MWRSRRSVLGFIFVGSIGLSACALVQAQTVEPAKQAESYLPAPIDLSGLSSPSPASPSNSGFLFQPGSIVVLQKAPSNLTVDQVAGLPASAFELFDATKTYPLSAGTALWLHFRVSGATAGPNLSWTFELPKPSVDLVEFYARNTQGGWHKQQAGNWLGQAQWTVRGTHPQFSLPLLTTTQEDFYVKVSQAVPLRFNVTLKAAESAIFHQQRTLFINSLLLGLMLCVSLIAFVLAVVYRNKVYAWYAAYVLFTFLALASYLGVAFFLFWPSSAWFPNLLSQVFLAAAVAAQVEFCRVLFVNPRSRPRLSGFIVVISLIIAATGVHALLAPTVDVWLRINLFVAAYSTGALLILAIVLKAVFERRLMAWLWMLAYTPVISVLALTLVEQFGLAPLPWLPYNAIGIALGFEVLTLLIALHLHVKSNHEWDVKQATLIEIDPLTGFLAPMYFPDTLAQLWSGARHTRQDLAVAYVRADINLGSARSAMKATDDELVLRCVRMLRMVTRADDTVARIGDNEYAILMPRMSVGPNFSSKLSRLVALGVMRDTDDPSQQIVRFRIAATTFGSFSGTSKQLDETLRRKLNTMRAESERTIDFVHR